MGYMMLMAPCYCCKRPFSSNPNLVPSIERKYPVCRDCIEAANKKRKTMGLELFVIPPGAYEPEEVA